MPVIAQVAAIIAWLFAALYGFGWLVDGNASRAVALVAVGLIFWALSTFGLGPPINRTRL